MRVVVPLSVQQADVLRATAERLGQPAGALLAAAVRALDGPVLATPAIGPVPDGARLVEAGTGAAVELTAGSVLRIEQVAGGQGVDLLAFAAADPAVRLDAARTRTLHGTRPTIGTVLWAAEAPLLTIIADSAPGHDLLFPACSPEEYELATGCRGHASCRAIELAVLAERGLCARDLHDPFNVWMAGGVDDAGELWWRHTPTVAGDHVELRAELDVVVVVNPCANDVFGEDRFVALPVALSCRPGRVSWARPAFDDAPLRRSSWVVELDDDLRPQLARARIGVEPPPSDGEIVRAAFFRWWASAAAAQPLPFLRPTEEC